MTRWPTVSLRETPATVPALAAIVLFVVWATSQAGYPLTHWAPGALIVLVLLAIAVLAVPLRFAEIPVAVKLALACLAAYTALSFLSILWAAAPAEAWEGANRTLLYLLVFALFSLWPRRGASAALLLGLWTLALIGLAAYVALRLDLAGGKSFEALFSGERLAYPVGYPNATAAQWLMAFWPALLLARGTRLPWALRGSAGRRRGRAGRRRAVQPEQGLAVRDAGDDRAGLRACAASACALLPRRRRSRWGLAQRLRWFCTSATTFAPGRAPMRPRTRQCSRCSPPRCWSVCSWLAAPPSRAAGPSRQERPGGCAEVWRSSLWRRCSRSSWAVWPWPVIR